MKIFYGLLIAFFAYGQYQDIPNNILVRNIPAAVNNNFANVTKVISGTTIPTTCTPSDYIAFYKTDTKQYYDCLQTNTYTLRLNSDSLGSLVGTTTINGTACLLGNSCTVSDSTKEPSLGNPSTNGYVLSSTTNGSRSWVSAGSGSMTYPSSGVPVSTGSSWGSSYTVGTSANNLVQLNSSGQLPAVSGANLTGLNVSQIPTAAPIASPTFTGTVTASTFSGSLSGNASTSSALASTPSLCPTGQAPTGILSNGNATGCASITSGAISSSSWPMSITRTSSTVLTIGADCTSGSPCNFGFGTQTVQITASATLTISSGSGTVYIWVQSDGTILAGIGSITATCSGCTTTTATSFPNSGAVPLASWVASASTWASSGNILKQSYSSDHTLSAGTGISITETATSRTISLSGSGSSSSATSYAVIFDGSTTSLSDGSTVTWSCGSGSGAQCTATWTVPSGVNAVRVTAWSGGGGGSGGSTNDRGGGGGGGGGYFDGDCAVTAGGTVSIAVGLGGPAGTTGYTSGTGGNTSLGTCFTLRGGNGGFDGTRHSWGGALNNSGYFGWVVAGGTNLVPDGNSSCSGTNYAGSHAVRTDGGGCGAAMSTAASTAGSTGGYAPLGGGGGGSGGFSSATGGAGGTSGLGGSGGAGGAWSSGGGFVACGDGSIPGGGGGGAGVSTGSNSTGCAGARGEVRIYYAR